jgi:hypothetical protein
VSLSHSGRSGFLFPPRAALARYTRSCSEKFGLGTEQNLVRISLAFPSIRNPGAHLPCLRWQRSVCGDSLYHQLWQHLRRHQPVPDVNVDEFWRLQADGEPGDSDWNRLHLERVVLPHYPGGWTERIVLHHVYSAIFWLRQRQRLHFIHHSERQRPQRPGQRHREHPHVVPVGHGRDFRSAHHQPSHARFRQSPGRQFPDLG